jgi:hypothetical protein
LEEADAEEGRIENEAILIKRLTRVPSDPVASINKLTEALDIGLAAAIRRRDKEHGSRIG